MTAGVAALRRFYRPFILIQAAAGMLVVSYHFSATVRAGCAILAAVKLAGGLPFSALAAAFAGGILPEIARRIAEKPTPGTAYARTPWAHILFNVAFFAFAGVVIDLFYRGQARLFGAGTDIQTIIKKAAFDQFVFNPLWQPFIVAIYLWRQQRFHFAGTLAVLRGGGFYKTRVLPLLLACWCFWIPMVSIVYALPGPLQFLLFVFALGAWSLIMVFIAGGAARDPD